MSGIGGTTSVGNSVLMDFEAELQKLEIENENVVTNYNNAKKVIADTLAWAKTLGLTDMNGKPLKFDTLQEFHDLCLKGGIKDSSGNPVNSGNSFWYVGVKQFLEDFAKAETALNKVKEKVNTIGASLREAIASMKSLDKLLQDGDIEGSVMLLQTTRSKLMDRQLGTQIKSMQDRNAQITKLNNDLTEAQTKLAGFSSTDTSDAKKAAQTKVGDLKTQIDALNSDSQIDMIRTQGLVNKRNEAFDTLTNLLGKFQKTIDGIVGNYR